MKTIKGWWFTTTDRKLANGDNRQIRIGRTHKVKGEIVPCEYGLHLSKRIIDALQYAPGPVIYKVEGSGTIIPHGDPIDKYACSERTYSIGGKDISDILRKFARLCALDVIHLWDAPDIVIKYLKTGDESLRAATRSAARSAAGSAARSAARSAVWSVAESAVESAAWSAAESAVGSAARSKQNRRLTRMTNRLLKEKGGERIT